ncbi:hypothetical protein GCM10027435_22010 [Haloparvum alkalitolerans]
MTVRGPSLVDVIPHYAVMLLAVFLAVGAAEYVAGDLSLWVELAIITAVVFTYRPVARLLGLAPDGW